MNTEKLKEFINNSDSSRIQKIAMTGFITRAEESEDKNSEDRQLVIDIANEKRLSEIVLSNDEVKIYKVSPNHTNKDGDDWNIKYPYRSIFKNKNGKWERSCTVSPSLDTAYLVYLENKYLGYNSRFSEFAIKMLEIKIEG